MDGSQDDILWHDTDESESERESSVEDEEDSDAEDNDKILWDDDNVHYTEEEWVELFGKSDTEEDGEEFDGF